MSYWSVNLSYRYSKAMFSKLIRFSLLVTFVLSINLIHAQEEGDTLNTQILEIIENDSLQAEQVNVVTDLLRKADSIRIADSLARVEMLRQLEQLKTTDNLQKLDLLNQIKEIEEADSLRKAVRIARIDSLKSVTQGFPVAPFKDTLFYIYNKLGPFSARDRATNITSKIKSLPNASEEIPELIVRTHEETADVIFGDLIILSVTSDDALWIGTTRNELAHVYKNAIESSIQDFYDDNTLKKILIRIGTVLLVVTILFIIIFYINRIFKFIKQQVYAQKGKGIQGIKLKNYEFLTAYRLIQLIFGALNFLKVVVIIVAFYFSLTLLFGIFPGTKNIADQLLNYFFTPIKDIFDSFIAFLPNLFTIGIIYLIIHYLIQFIRFLAIEVERGELVIPGFYPDWARPTYNIIRFFLYAFMFVLIYNYLPGSQSAVFQGVTIFIGLIISLGAMSAASNIVAGVVITYMRPFKIGDKVKIGKVSGEVLEKSLLVTRLRTDKNEDITVPNSSVLLGHTINYSSGAKDIGVIVHTSISVGFDVPWKTVHKLLIDAAKETKLVMENKKPFVLQTSLDDFYVSYQINVYTKQANKITEIKSELHQHILDKFHEAEIELLSPHHRTMGDETGNKGGLSIDSDIN